MISVGLINVSLFSQSGTVSWGNYHNAIESVSGILAPTTEFKAWENGAVAQNELAAFTDGWIGQTIPAYFGACSYAFGLSFSPEPIGSLSNLDYAFAFNGNDVLIYEKGGLHGIFGQIFPGDSIKIERSGTEMYFYINENPVFQLPVPSEIPLYIGASLGSPDCAMGFLATSEAESISVSADVDHVSCLTNSTGSIALSFDGGTAPYAVAWTQNGSAIGIGSTLSGVSEGTYTANIVDAQGVTAIQNITVSSKAVWSRMAGGSASGDSLIADNASSLRAVSENRILSGEAGWMEWVFDGTANHFVGLSSSDDLDLGTESINFAFSVIEGSDLAIYESGAIIGFFGQVSLGDTLRIERDLGGMITYYLNSSGVYQTVEMLQQDLMIRVEVPAGSTSSHPYSSFGCGSFVLNLVESEGETFTILGAGLDGTYPGDQAHTFYPTRPAIGQTAPVTLSFNAPDVNESYSISFEIDHSSRVLNPTYTYIEEGVNKTEPLGSRYVSMSNARIIGIGGRLRDLTDFLRSYCDFKNDPFREDACMNWTYSVSYGDNNARSEGIAYFDDGGRPTQAQVRMRSTNQVLASEVLYDRFGRQVISTLQAPTNKCYFKYDHNFTGGYDHTDFDGLTTRETPNPIPSASTLGAYYSFQNTKEPYVDISGWPYSRTDFVDDPTGQVKKAVGPGDTYRMGQGHEAYTATVPVHNELDHYISLRHHFTPHPASSVSLMGKATKTISRGPQGNYAISFGDIAACTIDPTMPVAEQQTNIVTLRHELTFTKCSNDESDFEISGTSYIEVYPYGNSAATYSGAVSGFDYSTLASGDFIIRSGKAFQLQRAISSCTSATTHYYPHMQLSSTSTGDVAADYVDIFLPPGCAVNGIGQYGEYLIENIWDGTVAEVQNPDGSYRTNLSSSEALNYLNNTGGGIFRISNLDDKPFLVLYKTNYDHWSYSYFDNRGQVVGAVAPEGIDLNSTAYPTFSSKTNYNSLGWVLWSESIEGDGSCANCTRRSEFVYDNDGKLLFSQNELQRQTEKFSYIVYDKNNRPIESGEYDPIRSGSANYHFYFQTHEEIENNTNPPSGYLSIFNLLPGESPANLDPNRCSERSFTQYDKHDFNTLSGLGIPQAHTYHQRYLMGQVSKTWDDLGNTTWYSYDAQGRTSWMVQKLGGLAPKTIHYRYDFQGNLLEVGYQKNTHEAFHHKYVYDEDNRLVRSYISNDGVTWDEQSEYKYYAHGPLKRVELDKDLQGIDYVYTIDGKLKQMNTPYQADQWNSQSNTFIPDPGNDGAVNSKFPTDVFGFALDYNLADYGRVAQLDAYWSSGNPDRFDGNIRSFRWNTLGQAPTTNNGAATGFQMAYDFSYNSLGQMETAQFGTTSGFTINSQDQYKVFGMNYDRNGNIKNLNRNTADANDAIAEIDRMTYHYVGNSNMLDYVSDNASADGQHGDLANQSPGNYSYDALGQLIHDKQGKIKVSYTPAGLVNDVRYFDFANPNDPQNDKQVTSFDYNERGHRIAKHSFNTDGSLNHTTYYVCDAAGQLLSMYKKTNSGEGHISTKQTELPIYGTGRLGMYYRGDKAQNKPDQKFYQMSDHLGNVRAVITRIGNTPMVTTASDYYPFGWKMPNRGTQGGEQYRYAYQGQERDEETGWEAFELRMWDGRLARWMSIDPYNQYASPYVGMGNNPVGMVDPNGGWADWVEDANGNIYWDDNATSQATAKQGETYLGKNVLVGTHARNAEGDEPINGAVFEIYLESNKTGPSASLVGNTIPSDKTKNGTLAEGLYPARSQARGKYIKRGQEDLAVLINEGGELPTVFGNPNKKHSDMLTEVFFHRGNDYRESLFDSQGVKYSHGCQTGGCYAGAHAAHNEFMGVVGDDFNGSYYLRAKPKPKPVPLLKVTLPGLDTEIDNTFVALKIF